MLGKKAFASATALLVGLGAAGVAQAGDPIDLGNGVQFDWRLNTTYSLGMRVRKQDPVLAASSGANDGNNNFDRGSLTANRLSALLETRVSKDETGFVLSGSAFLDGAYLRRNDNEGPVNHPGPAGHFTNDTRRVQGRDARILDAYGYTSFDLGSESRLNMRLGRQVVSWGEALFFPSISLAQGPSDATKSGIPGTETKDLLLPEDQVSFQLEATPNLSLLAHAQFNWQPTLVPATGAYLSTSDSVGAGASCLGPYATLPSIRGVFGGFSGCSFGRRGDDIEPNKLGQWGVGARYRVTEETELGLYFLNYHDRSPIPEINSLTPGVATPALFGLAGNQIGNGSYRIRYFDNIKLAGATFSTSLGPAVLAGEFSHKFNAPVLVNTVVNPATGATVPSPTRADVTQMNVNVFNNLGRTSLAPQTQLLAEIAGVHVSQVNPRKAPGVEGLGTAAAFFPETTNLAFGRNGVAVSATLSLGYPGIIEKWDLSVPISYSHQIYGRSFTGGVGGQGDARYSIGATMTYEGNLQIGLNYLGYLGGGEATNLAHQRLLADRDQISMVAKYSF